MTTAHPQCINGEAKQPFALVDVGNPPWWNCVSCGGWDVNPIWRNRGLFGFRCMSCNHLWHYEATIIERKERE